MTVFAALKFFFVLLKTSRFFKLLLVSFILLDCTAAAFKIRIEQNTMIVIGINIVITVKEIYNVDSPETS